MKSPGPPVRIILYILLVAAVFLSNSILVDLGILAAVFAFTLTVPLQALLRGIVPITIFLLFTFISNILFQTGRVILDVWGLLLTEEGLRRGGHLTLRLVILIIGAKILTASTKAEDLIKAVTYLLGPFGRLKPVREFVYTASVALRFLPVIYNEAHSLYAETIQGYPKNTLTDKIKASASLLAPLFERSMKKARDLQNEMSDVMN